jgi:mannose/cellobiose epimerase-like protein (N-acyl-D-glucosamine 2-epimerase family)
MPAPTEIADLLARTEGYLTRTLLPFWIERSGDPEGGGFLTYFDRRGRAAGETTKTFLMQIRMLYTMASAHRAGYGGGRCAELAEMGAAFLREHYWDDEHDGWAWIADAQAGVLRFGRDAVGRSSRHSPWTSPKVGQRTA